MHVYAWACQEQRPHHSITLTLHPLTQIQKIPRIYAEIFGPNLAVKLFYRSPLGVMHCIRFGDTLKRVINDGNVQNDH